jgi:hypothetical protein
MQFDFGKNWEKFSKTALNEHKVKQARDDFVGLFKDIELKNKSFIDIGFGQGLSLLTATALGAVTTGIDINPLSEGILRKNAKYFPEVDVSKIKIYTGSVLDTSLLENITHSGKNEFDVVHSWGVLHHTGNLYKSIQLTCNMVQKQGYYIIAIYNKHWSSRIWLWIKWFYNYSPVFLKKFFIYFCYPVIWVAKFLVTGKNPKKQQRGMDFFYDIIDWVGGYPYEYASKEQIKKFVESQGFKLLREIPAKVPTGCNEFVFIKI